MGGLRCAGPKWEAERGLPHKLMEEGAVGLRADDDGYAAPLNAAAPGLPE